jgi:hypothetical protein
VKKTLATGLVLLAMLAAQAAVAADATAQNNDAVIKEVLGILKERGIVDQSRYEELMAQNQKYEQKQSSLLGRIEWSGDLRARLENFWYNEDKLGNTQGDRTRVRYRLRLQGKAEINKYLDAVFRIASGEGDWRSTNYTLGHNYDFFLNNIWIDRAYIAFHAPGSWLDEHGKLDANIGKVPNPFLWKTPANMMIWDDDINPEGLAVQLTYNPTEQLTLSANSGIFIIKENGAAQDPLVTGIQAAAEYAADDNISVGGQASFYSFASLDTGFFSPNTSNMTTSGNGNIIDGITRGAPNTGNDGVQALAFTGYVGYNGFEDWPLQLWGSLVDNMSAVASNTFAGVGKDNLGWAVGVSAGDSKKLAQFNLGYYYLEANFWPAMFTDSDLLDGFTNRKGFMLQAKRQIMQNTDLVLTLFRCWDIENNSPGYNVSLANANRFRLQTDISVKF